MKRRGGKREGAGREKLLALAKKTREINQKHYRANQCYIYLENLNLGKGSSGGNLRKRFGLCVMAARFGAQTLGGGGGGTSLYKLFWDVPPQRVWFLSCFGLKMGIDFDHYGLKSGMVFKGTTGAHKRIKPLKTAKAVNEDSACLYVGSHRRSNQPNLKNNDEKCKDYCKADTT